ncbi:MAG: glycosyltransferase family 4 protein [Firmicutes bacterium]|nr:glycosyltransferase family 4 protein [Bacillota bacterium]
MRIIYITSSLPYGPGEAFIIPEIEELKRQGHDVLLVPMYPRGKVFHDKAEALLGLARSQPLLSWEILKRALSTAVKTPVKAFSALALLVGHSRSVRIIAKNLAVYPKGLWLAYVAKEWRAEHVHAHWAATTATMALVAGELADVPWSFTAHRWDIAENNLIALKARKAAFARAIDRRGAQELAAFANWGNWLPHVIHMGVALPLGTEHGRAPIESDVFRAVMAANFVKIKGHAYLVEAVQLLRGRGVRIRVDLLGDGPLRSAIERKVRDYGLDEELKFLGSVPHGRLMAQLQAGAWDLMVLPSIEDQAGEREGIPVSLMEAMSCGVPVISASTGGIPELLDGDAGILVPPKNPIALAEAIERLARDQALRRQLAEAGRRRVQEQFKLETVVAELALRFAGCRRTEG